MTIQTIVDQSNKHDIFGKKFCFLWFMSILFITLNLVGGAVVYKVIKIGAWLGPGGLIILPITLLIEDIIAELYGYKISRLLLWYTFISYIIFSITIILIIRIPSPAYWHNENAYLTVFGSLLRAAPVTILAIFIGRFVNVILLTKFKALINGRLFWLRCIIATSVGGVITISIFFSIAFWGVIPTKGIEEMFISDYLVRVIYAIIGSFPANILVIMLKKKLEIDVYDFHTNFNPFKLSLND